MELSESNFHGKGLADLYLSGLGSEDTVTWKSDNLQNI